MGMRCPQIAGEFVQCVVADKSVGRRVQYTVFGVQLPYSGASSSRITLAEHLGEIAIQQRLDTGHV